MNAAASDERGDVPGDRTSDGADREHEQREVNDRLPADSIRYRAQDGLTDGGAQYERCTCPVDLRSPSVRCGDICKTGLTSVSLALSLTAMTLRYQFGTIWVSFVVAYRKSSSKARGIDGYDEAPN